MSESIDFTTLGMFIIDQIHYGPAEARKMVDGVMGGAGTFAIYGARLFSPPPASEKLGWIIDAGYDFPEYCVSQIEALKTHAIFRNNPGRKTTQGWNSYGPGEHRAFEYLSPKRRLEVQDLLECGLLRAKAMHLICSPQRAQIVRKELFSALKLAEDASPPTAPWLVWEPVPDLCTPENRDEMFKTLPLVDVISPNHDELAGFFADLPQTTSIKNTKEGIEELARRLLEVGVGQESSGAVVVRAGHRGSFVISKNVSIWLPAYYASEEDNSHRKVVDTTGAGNSFLGGLGAGLAQTKGNLVYAVAMGIVAASFVIEQIGTPVLESKEGQPERWNGVRVDERMEEYVKRVRRMGVVL